MDAYGRPHASVFNGSNHNFVKVVLLNTSRIQRSHGGKLHSVSITEVELADTILKSDRLGILSAGRQ
jgi:hypothetical protein